MNAVRINHDERTIVITKKFAKDASAYGTEAYNKLRKIKIDNPGYEVVVREVAKKTSSINRITLKTMENYIKMHDTDGKIMEEFKKLRDEKTGENLHKTTFFEIKQWFFETYSDLKDEIKAA